MKDKFNSVFRTSSKALIKTVAFSLCACAVLMLATCTQPINGKQTPKTWAVTVQYEEGQGVASATPNPAEKGKTVTLTAEPASSYKFKAWQVVSGGVVLYSVNTNPATFTMPAGEVTIRVEFEALADITLDALVYGYAQPAKRSIPIASLGITTQTVKNVTLGDGETSAFVLDTTDLQGKISVGNVLNFLVQPKAGLKAGTYTDTVTVTHKNDKTAVFSMEITVNPKPVTITGLGVQNKEYNGTTDATLNGTATVGGVIAGEDVQFDYGWADFENKNAGNGKAVNLGGCMLSGADAGNYILPELTGFTADITPRIVTIVIRDQPERTLVPFGTTDVIIGGVKFRQNDTMHLTVGNNRVLSGETVSVSVGANDYGLSGSANIGAEGGTLTVFYDGREVNQISVNVRLNVTGNYKVTSNVSFNISILDGLAADRQLPLANANLGDFKVYVNTVNGMERYYKLVEDITLPTPQTGGSNWTAIGASDRPFTGNFDGNNFAINNLLSTQGMFGYIGEDGKVINTALVGGNVTGDYSVGGIAGVNYGTIQKCYTTGNVSGTSYVGGIVGQNQGTVMNCYTTGNVSGEERYIGGVIGQNYKNVRYCHAMGRVIGTTGVGGVAGYVHNVNAELKNCAALNSLVATKGVASNANRVVGVCSVLPMLSNNYARSDMEVWGLWNQSGVYKKTTFNSGLATLDGQSVAMSQYKTTSASWWTTSGNWSGSVWDFSSAWQMNEYDLPKLRNVGGSQDHIQMDPIEMVSISAGYFTMGSPNSEADRYSDEGPQHTVTLAGFSMSKYQITQEQYAAVMGTTPSHFKGPSNPPATGEIQRRRPVEYIRWFNALVFCNKLSIQEGLSPAYRISGSTNPADWGGVPGHPSHVNIGNWNAVEIVSGSTGYRLPTEAQWEYACRAGTTTAFYTGATITNNTGWYTSNSNNMTHQVGLKPANAWGLYDMHGNVGEWCWDWYGDYSSGTQTDPLGPSSGTHRVLRGGSFDNSASTLRSAMRKDLQPYFGQYILYASGFRVVRP